MWERPGGWPISAAFRDFTASTPTSVSGSDNFLSIPTLFLRLAAKPKLEKADLEPWVIFFTWIFKLASAGKAWFQEWVWVGSNSLANSLVRTESSKGRVVGWIC